MSFNNLLIIPNYLKCETIEYAKKLFIHLKEKGVNATILPDNRFDTEGNPIFSGDYQLAIVLGGDGSVLLAKKFIQDKDIPVICINFGHLGYLSECSPEQGFERIDSILDGRFTIEERIMLAGGLYRDQKSIFDFHAVNDAVIHRSGYNHPLNFKISINGNTVTNLLADGIIASTPTGSTAYNLSIGGPIITPSAHSFVFTPIAPRFGSCPSIVTSADDVIELHVEKSRLPLENATLCIDGDRSVEIKEGDIITISLSSRRFHLLKVNNKNSYKTIL